MPHTLSAVHGPLGAPALVSPAVRAEALAAAGESLAEAVKAGSLHDARAELHGDALVLILAHSRGEADSEVHRLAWDALAAGAAVLRRFAPDTGRGVVAEAFPGHLSGTGASSAELVLNERPTGPLVLLLGAGVAAGVFNLPLVRAFADPFTTPGLVQAPSLRRGFNFEVHDLDQQQKMMFAAPAELHDLLACVASPGRCVVKRIVTPDGGIAAVTSTDQRAQLAGTAPADDAPLAIVRSGGDAPALREVLSPFMTPSVVQAADGRLAVTAPLRVDDEAPLQLAHPHLFALGFEWVEGRLTDVVDLFADDSFDDARADAAQLREVLAGQGPFHPRGPRAEPPRAAEPGMAQRWTPL